MTITRQLIIDLYAWNTRIERARQEYAAHAIAFTGKGTCRKCAGPTTTNGGCRPCKQAKRRAKKGAA